MIACIISDCDFDIELHLGPDDKLPNVERQKRIVIDHINNDHVDAHVIAACAHEWHELERLDATIILKENNDFGQAGDTVVLPQVHSQCVRCEQFQMADAEPDAIVDASGNGTHTTLEAALEDVAEGQGVPDGET